MEWFADTLRAKNRSTQTIESYRLTLATFDRSLADSGQPRDTAQVTRPMVQAFITDQLGGVRVPLGHGRARYDLAVLAPRPDERSRESGHPSRSDRGCVTLRYTR
jgi:hypothetical protein